MSQRSDIELVRGRQPRPFGDWVLEARRLGFEIFYDFDQSTFTMEVMLKPVSRRARTAVDRYLDSSHPDNCILATTTYDKARAEMVATGIEPPPYDDEEKVLAFARDDTAAYAIRMAQEAMARG